ncbi:MULTISPECIES: hypothetical protein [unclassified Beijerinckia]|uniref:hypothetical protein n=1 Tax=unclassified Beijerinckia TaxID=2638183 RepID=UPI00089D883C|nr:MULTISPECIES: hypothetical protein [unclassified Beijerinckia]MDH7794779.1 hypothetical protein [Beijerinckia sp. GAS462]SEB74861.1 hypothetical protein SAMN05443249_1054 [Beijerinckia sp. 28-YEA-48]
MSDVLNFPFKPIRMLLWLFLFFILTAGFLWMGWLSLSPHFYDHSNGRYAWFGDLMHSVPVPLRAGFWVLIAAVTALGGVVFLRRWLSGIPPLSLSAQGITGFSKGFGLKQTTIPWAELGDVSVMKSNLTIAGTAIDTGGIRKPKPPTISFNTSMIGQKPNKLLERIADYRNSLSQAK